MESILEAARRNSQEKTCEVRAKEFTPSNVNIAVVGVGGGGTNTVTRLKRMGIQSANTFAINTDAKHLGCCEADKKILIGHTMTRGLGAGGFPEVGMRAAEQSRERFAEILKNYQLVFITSGMGGGTGTGASPVIAEVAKQQGAIVVAMVTFPFALERARLSKADWGLERLREACDTVVLIDNNKLVKLVPNLPMNQAFEVADTLIARSVKGISDTILLPSLVNIDFADVRSIMSSSGEAIIAVGEGSGSNRVQQAIESTLNHPLMDVDYHGAKGALIHIAGGTDLTLCEVTKVGEGITSAFDSRANVIWGARVVPEMQGKIIVTAVLTGINSPQVMGRTPSEVKQKRGVQEAVAKIHALSF